MHTISIKWLTYGKRISEPETRSDNLELSSGIENIVLMYTNVMLILLQLLVNRGCKYNVYRLKMSLGARATKGGAKGGAKDGKHAQDTRKTTDKAQSKEKVKPQVRITSNSSLMALTV